MTHQVSLSRVAYQALREAKEPGESFSDVVLRLLRERETVRRDPWKFVRAPRDPVLDLERRLAEVDAWRDADRISRG